MSGNRIFPLVRQVGIVLFIAVMDDLLSEIEPFLKRAGMTPTAFGREALGDPSFVPDLRNGRRVWPETEEKVRNFIASRKETTQ